MIAETINYLDELKDLIKLHLTSQGENPEDYQKLLDSITKDSHEGTNSWANQWIKKGDKYYDQGDKNNAMMCYNFGRFPFINNHPRSYAHEKCIHVFEEIYLQNKKGARRVYIKYKDLRIPVYLSGQWKEKKPLLLVMGGIVSIKEQWGVLLEKGKKLGYAVCVCEFPSVGENQLSYTEDSYMFIHAILDQLSEEKEKLKAALMGISFSGELMLKTAATRGDILGVLCSGSPIKEFFVDNNWQKQVPLTTIKTLEHLCGLEVKDLYHQLNRFAIEEKLLKNIKAPIKYICSTLDDIIPPAEAIYLKNNIREAEILELDDVHGGLNSMSLIKKYIPMSLVEFKKGKKNIVTLLLRSIVSRSVKKHKSTIQI